MKDDEEIVASFSFDVVENEDGEYFALVEYKGMERLAGPFKTAKEAHRHNVDTAKYLGQVAEKRGLDTQIVAYPPIDKSKQN